MRLVKTLPILLGLGAQNQFAELTGGAFAAYL